MKIKKIINKDVINIIKNLSNIVEKPKNFDNFKEYLKVSDKACLRIYYEYIFIKPILDLTIHKEVLKNNKHLKNYKSLENNLTDIPELKECYSKIKNELELLEDVHRSDFLIMLYNTIMICFIGKKSDVEGVVYTPKKVTDFMVNSTNELCKKYFNKSIYDRDVRILDPFLGTGNYIESIIESSDDLIESDINGYEINPLSHLIASLNIENKLYLKYKKYIPFNNMKMCDTFREDGKEFILIGNPPYSRGQSDLNENNKNKKHVELEKIIKDNYGSNSRSQNRNAIYDSYVKAIKWSEQRIGDEGIIVYITNNSFLKGFSFDGMRRCLSKDFNRIYILDLGGENGNENIFNIKVGVSINFFIKSKKLTDYKINYKRVDEKEKTNSLEGLTLENIKWKRLELIEDFDPSKKLFVKRNGKEEIKKSLEWFPINNREEFNQLTSMCDQTLKHIMRRGKSDNSIKSIFKFFTTGLITAQDNYLSNFNKYKVFEYVKKSINEYENQRLELEQNNINDIIYDSTKINWTKHLIGRIRKNEQLDKIDDSKIIKSICRPFTRKYLYFDKVLIDTPASQNLYIPINRPDCENIIICVTGIDKDQRRFSSFVSTNCVHFDLITNCQTFPLYVYYEDGNKRYDNITDWSLNEFRNKYSDKSIEKIDIFYYIYGILNHPEYSKKYADNLSKKFPRIPFVKDFHTFSKIGKQLTNLHINYEQVEPYENIIISEKNNISDLYRVVKMKLKDKDKETLKIIYNDHITLENIPRRVLDYKIVKKSPLEYIIDQYKIKIDKKSGHIDDPNDIEDPKKIINLIKRIINVSLKTIDLIEEFPPLENL